MYMYVHARKLRVVTLFQCFFLPESGSKYYNTGWSSTQSSGGNRLTTVEANLVTAHGKRLTTVEANLVTAHGQ